MSAVVLNEVRKGFYLDSVALMRLSRSIAAGDGVEEAALMMGTPANHEILADAGLMAEDGRGASGGDLILTVRAATQEQAEAALKIAREELDAPSSPKPGGAAAALRPRSIMAAADDAPSASLALISVPGAFAVAEARKAIHAGLNAMIFSDNVPIADEAALKAEARDLGRLVMGPDCGTAILSGTPLAFANVVPPGDIGIIGASGTGIQEVTSLIAQMGGGISQAIGTGGRDLKSEVGGIITLMALDALAEDAETRSIVVIAKPPDDTVADRVIEALQACGKPTVVCFMGANAQAMPDGIKQVFTLQEAAFAALGQLVAAAPAPEMAVRYGGILGLFSGGTLCAEAQVILRDAGLTLSSNAPIPGAGQGAMGEAVILDLGDDAYTQGRPHPMIDPAVREGPLRAALARDDLAAVLVDVVIGYGAHDDPATELSRVVADARHDGGPVVICSVTGTEADPQVLSAQIATLRQAGIHVAPCAADAARWALVAAARR